MRGEGGGGVLRGFSLTSFVYFDGFILFACLEKSTVSRLS